MTFDDALHALSSRTFTPAIATFLGYIAYDRTDGEAWLYLGIAYTESGLHTDALQALHVAELLVEDNPELEEALGVTWLRMGDLQEAHRYFQQALLHPNPPTTIHRNMALMHLQSNDPERALPAIDRGISHNPDDVMNWYVKTLVLRACHDSKLDSKDYRFELKAALKELLGKKNTPPGMARSVREQLNTLF